MHSSQTYDCMYKGMHFRLGNINITGAKAYMRPCLWRFQLLFPTELQIQYGMLLHTLGQGYLMLVPPITRVPLSKLKIQPHNPTIHQMTNIGDASIPVTVSSVLPDAIRLAVILFTLVSGSSAHSCLSQPPLYQWVESDALCNIPPFGFVWCFSRCTEMKGLGRWTQR